MLHHYVQEAEGALTTSQKFLKNCKEYNPGKPLLVQTVPKPQGLYTPI